MKDGWEKISLAIGDTVSTTTYANMDYPGIRLESVKEKKKNNSPRGFWVYSHYYARCGEWSKEFWRLKDAKEYVEKHRGEIIQGKEAMIMQTLLISAEEWAKTQKRVTNRSLRDRFDISEDIADEVYKVLQSEGVIGSMGYVEEKR